MKTAVIYARYSSDNQSEQSIEGQLKVCYEYARAHGFNVIEEYIDRAQSGTSDNRSSFQRMINDTVYTIVREVFERYSQGENATDIIGDLNDRNICTSRGNQFIKNSLHRMFRNKRCIGIYTYKDTEIVGSVLRIIDDGLFYRVQDILKETKWLLLVPEEGTNICLLQSHSVVTAVK